MSEAFPTVIRSLAVRACVCWSRVVGLVAPQVLLLSDSSYSWMLFLVIGCLSLFRGFFGLPLPGTGRRALPDAVLRVERNRKHNDDIVSDVDCGASPRWIIRHWLIAGGPANGAGMRSSLEQVPPWAAVSRGTIVPHTRNGGHQVVCAELWCPKIM